MDDFQKLQQRAYGIVLLLNILSLGLGILIWTIAWQNNVTGPTAFGITCVGILISSTITSYFASRHILQPLKILWQTILHVSPDTVSVPPPNITDLGFGHELVVSLTNRVYQFASKQDNSSQENHRATLSQAVNIVKLFPQPLFVFNRQQIVTNASTSALEYLNLNSSDLFGQKLFDKVNLEFSTSFTLQEWINDCQANKVTDHAYWQRVRLTLDEGKTIKQCDITAHYNRENESGTEFIVTFTDHTESYGKDDEALSFIALAVHELRTPLTMMRGYVEVFEEELEDKLDEELTDYLHKLHVSTDQLASFVTNILNVIKVDENQLSLTLSEENWDKTLRHASTSMLARAKVLGKNITFKIDENLPTVAVDPTSISEVMNNLLDNAIKYSADSNEIIVTTKLNQEGMIETTVQDSGVGIGGNVIANIFDRFYRNHRTRDQFGGTGLGLYLCKAIVTAHGGNIWVRSKPDEGSSFTFTLQPYSSLGDGLKNNRKGITRQAHGWIKNHNMYRR